MNIANLTAGRLVLSDGSKNLISSSYSESDIFDLAINTQAASYTLQLSDARRTLVQMNVASANNLILPPNATVAIPIGSQILISQIGVGQTTILPGAGVTLVGADSAFKIRARWGACTVVKTATNTWSVYGDMTV